MFVFARSARLFCKISAQVVVESEATLRALVILFERCRPKLKPDWGTL